MNVQPILCADNKQGIFSAATDHGCGVERLVPFGVLDRVDQRPTGDIDVRMFAKITQGVVTERDAPTLGRAGAGAHPVSHREITRFAQHRPDEHRPNDWLGVDHGFAPSVSSVAQVGPKQELLGRVRGESAWRRGTH